MVPCADGCCAGGIGDGDAGDKVCSLLVGGDRFAAVVGGKGEGMRKRLSMGRGGGRSEATSAWGAAAVTCCPGTATAVAPSGVVCLGGDLAAIAG